MQRAEFLSRFARLYPNNCGKDLGAIYQALYRKYRPRTFDEVCGQEHITGTLRAQVASGRLSHAYLFVGTRGTGKTTCAKILAKAVNCLHPVNGNPCGECAACRGIDEGSVLDVVEIDAASNNGVENVRALREEAVFSPASVKKRVYIIDEVHMLSTAAFNALLKILEEPPEHLMFILATTELRKVPATILSRCQRYSFRRLDSRVISARLDYIAAQEGFNLTPGASELLARLADGGMRDAISLLDQCSGAETIDEGAVADALGLAGGERISDLLSAVARHDSAAALEMFAGLWRDGKDPSVLLSDLCSLMRDVLLLSIAPRAGSQLLSGAYGADTLRGFSKSFTRGELLRAMERTQEAIISLRDNPSPRTAVELCLVSLCDLRLCDGLPELRARVSRLEAGAAAPAEDGGLAGEDVRQPESAPRAAEPSRPAAEDAPGAAEQSPAGTETAPPRDGRRTGARTEPPVPEQGRAEAQRQAPEEVQDSVTATLPDSGDNAGRPGGELTWERLLELMKTRLPVGIFNLLTDPLQAMGEFTGEGLRLQLAHGFARDMLGKPEVIEKFRAAAAELAGSQVAVSVSEMDSGEKIATRSIEELRRFKEVQFT